MAGLPVMVMMAGLLGGGGRGKSPGRADGGRGDLRVPAEQISSPADGGEALSRRGDAVSAEGAARPDLPPFTGDCQVCHDPASLGVPGADPQQGLRQWMESKGAGLVRRDSAFPDGALHLSLEWPRRGSHAEAEDASGCGLCHPVGPEGIGHGVRTYPEELLATVFTGGASCADECHGWLVEDVTVTGFEDGTGQVPFYQGSARPADLLAAGGNAHSTLWQEGARPQVLPMKIAAFNSGCGGCHHVAGESHGAIMTCTDCHGLAGSQGSQLHEQHVEFIAQHSSRLDPVHEGESGCGFCHLGDTGDPELHRAACYSCHLSGHQPLDVEGRAHFWPLP